MPPKAISVTALTLGLVVWASACSSLPRSPHQWRDQMRQLAQDLSYVLPNLYSAPDAPENTGRMRQLTAKLRELAQDLATREARPSADPSSAYLGLNFEGEVKGIELALDENRLKDARQRVLKITRYCYNCHTQRPGPNDSVAFLFRYAEIDPWTEVEKADFFAAIRDFDGALAHYERALLNRTWAWEHPDQWAVAFEKALGITLRVARNASVGIVLINRFALGTEFPPLLAPHARAWKRELEHWKLSQSENHDDDSAADYIARARLMLGLSSRPSKDPRAGLVRNLMAILELQEAFRRAPSPEQVAEALDLHGEALARLEYLGFASQSVDYWRACRDLPGAGPWAKKCAEHMRARIDDLPVNERGHL